METGVKPISFASMRPSFSFLGCKALISNKSLAFHHLDSDSRKPQSLLSSSGMRHLNIWLNQCLCDYILTRFFIKEPKKNKIQVRKIFSSLVAYWFSVDNRLVPIIN